MSISSLFKGVGAPLKNIRWSWGAVNPNSGAVFLRVWKDDVRNSGNGHIVRLTNRAHFEGTSSLGYAERLKHIELLREGRPGYLVFCESKQPGTIPRQLKRYVSDRMFLTGALVEVDGDIYVEFIGGVAINDI